MKKINALNRLLNDKNLTTKVKVFMSSTSYGDDYDPYEGNITYDTLNYITIKAYVREISPETAFWKQYGRHQAGAKEIICEKRWRSAFEKCAKIEIGDVEYQTFIGANNKTLITERPNQLLRVVVVRKD